MNTSDGFELRWIVDVLRRRIQFILGFVLVIVLLAGLLTSLQPREYTATVTLLIDPAHNDTTNQYSGIIAGEQLALTYSQMIKTYPVMQQVISQLKLNETPDSLASKIQVTTVTNTQLIRLAVSGSSAANAIQLADTLSKTFVAYINQLNTERYNATLTTMKAKLDASAAQIQAYQEAIDKLNAESILDAAEITRLQNLLSQARIDYQNLQQNDHAVQLTASQVKGTVSTLADARLVNGPAAAPAASIIFWIDQGTNGGSAGTATYTQILSGKPVLDAAIQKMGLAITSGELQTKMTVSAESGSQLITLTVSGKDPSQTLLIANTIAQIFVDQVNALLTAPFTSQLASIQKQLDDQQAQIDQTQTQIGKVTADQSQTQTQLTNLTSLITETRNDYRTLQQDYEQLQLASINSTNSIAVADPAQAPEVSLIGLIIRNSGLAGLVAVILSIGLVFLFEYLNDSLKTAKDVNQTLGLSPLGIIGHVKNGENAALLENANQPGVSEDFRIFRANIQFIRKNTPLKTLLITSPASSEGKSLVVANLAISFAEMGFNVIAADLDLRIPRLHQIFNVDREDGLVDALMSGNQHINLQPSGMEGLRILTSGMQNFEPAMIVNSPGLGQLFAEMGGQGDLIVLDGPPVLPVADTSILASQVDGVILVVRARVTSRQCAQDAIETLRKAKANLIGVVLNDVADRDRHSYYAIGGISLKEYRRQKWLPASGRLAQALKSIHLPGSRKKGTDHLEQTFNRRT